MVFGATALVALCSGVGRVRKCSPLFGVMLKKSPGAVGPPAGWSYRSVEIVRSRWSLVVSSFRPRVPKAGAAGPPAGWSYRSVEIVRSRWSLVVSSFRPRVATLRGLWEVSRAQTPRAHARGSYVTPRCAGYKRRNKWQTAQASQVAQSPEFSSGQARGAVVGVGQQGHGSASIEGAWWWACCVFAWGHYCTDGVFSGWLR